MTVRVSCPYCNTGFNLPEVLPMGRATCPRCGEAFPVRAVDPDAADQPLSPVPPTALVHGSPSANAHSIPRPTPPTKPNVARLVALVLLIVGVGSIVVYFTAGARRPSPEPTVSPAATVSPLEFAGLAYLPPDANIVLAVRPGPVLAYAERTGQDPLAVLARAGIPASALATLDRLGVPLPVIDHLAAGIRVPEADLADLRVAVALVLRQPLADEERFLSQTKARRSTKDGKTRYEAEFNGIPLKLAKASGTVWVFGWSDRDLDPAETGGKTQLSAGLRETIGEQVPTNAAGWVATDTARWADKPLVKFAISQFGKRDWLPVLEKGRAAAVGLTFDDPPRLRLFIRCGDTDTGEKLRAYFQTKASGNGTHLGGTGDWATLDTPVASGGSLSMLKGFLDDVGK